MFPSCLWLQGLWGYRGERGSKGEKGDEVRNETIQLLLYVKLLSPIQILDLLFVFLQILWKESHTPECVCVGGGCDLPHTVSVTAERFIYNVSVTCTQTAVHLHIQQIQSQMFLATSWMLSSIFTLLLALFFCLHQLLRKKKSASCAINATIC